VSAAAGEAKNEAAIAAVTIAVSSGKRRQESPPMDPPIRLLTKAAEE
jgi:hypothetical protein